MKELKSTLLTAIVLFFSIVSYAQVKATFEIRNGYVYAVLTNYNSTTAAVSWRCVNYQLGQYKDGSIYLKPGYETCIGPNVGWYWQIGENLIWQVAGVQNNISFRGSHGDATPPSSSSDGYIYQGYSVKYRGLSYKLYKKSGYKYIYDRIDGWTRID